MIVQSNYPCTKCGSFYRIDGKCNICGTELGEKVQAEERYVPRTQGKTWSKKKHRYLKHGEVE